MRGILVLFWWTFTAAAQGPSATLSGRVADPSGAMVPGVVVALEDVVVKTDAQGVYTISGVKSGRHRVVVTAPGFAEYARVIVVRGRRSTHDVRLSVAPVAEQVLVTAKSPLSQNRRGVVPDNVHASVNMGEIRESPARDAGEALASLEGLAKIRKGGIANDVLLRGLAHDNINVLVDGARVNGACPNGMDPRPSHVDFSEIERVEVTKGAFDIANQGSLGGAINIVTKEPDGGLRFTPSLMAGSFGFYNPSLVGSYSGEKMWALAGYSLRVSEPYRDGAGRLFTAYANYRPDSAADAFRIHTGWFRLGGAPAPGQRLALSYSRQEGGETLYPYLLMDAGYDNADRITGAWQVSRTGVVDSIRTEVYATRVKHWMTDKLRTSAAGAPLGYSMATFAETLTFGGKTTAQVRPDLTVGVEAYRRRWDGVNTRLAMTSYSSQHSIPAPTSDLAGAYAQYRRSVTSRLHVTLGVRLDGASSHIDAADAPSDLYRAYRQTRSTGTRDVMPSANAWAGYTRGGVEFFFGGGHTARLPDPVERYIAFQRMGTDWVGNPELRPTRNTEADAGFTWRTRRLLVQPTVFYSRLADFVTVQNQARIVPAIGMANTMARSFANVDAHSYGGELKYTFEIARPLLLAGGASFTRSTKDAAPQSGVFDTNVAEIPPLRSHTSLRYRTRRVFVESAFTAVAAQQRVDRGLQESPTPGYAVVDLKAGVHASRVDVAFGIGNVLDRFYYEHGSYQRDPFRSGVRVPEPGRNLFLTAQYRF